MHDGWTKDYCFLGLGYFGQINSVPVIYHHIRLEIGPQNPFDRKLLFKYIFISEIFFYIVSSSEDLVINGYPNPRQG